jgi:hypothetical protein
VFIAAAAATEDFGTPKVCMQRVMGTYWGVYICTCRYVHIVILTCL